MCGLLLLNVFENGVTHFIQGFITLMKLKPHEKLKLEELKL